MTSALNHEALERACRAWINAACTELRVPRAEFVFKLRRWFGIQVPEVSLFCYDDLAFIRQAYALWSAHT